MSDETKDGRRPTAGASGASQDGTRQAGDEDGRGASAVGVDRRSALKAMASTAMALPVLSAHEPAPATPAPGPGATERVPAELAAPGGPRGTAWDPDLVRPRVRWSNKLTAAELVTLASLCDMIIPADSKSPAASTVGVPAYINEVVSAPYDWAERDLVQLRGGLAWLNTESRRRFSRTFARLTNAQRTAICDDICYQPRARDEHQAAAKFFDRVRDLTAEGFYTTDAGMKDIGYVGNVALPKFEGPPPAVLKHLGLDR